jgi:RNA-directed DNA polymerase
MITNTVIDATVHKPQSLSKYTWKTIPWKIVNECVRRLQIRIAKAWSEGRYKKVKDLQRLLLKSYYARMLATKRVTDNKGSKTPGVDNILWKSPQSKMEAVNQLGKGTYTPLPLKRIYILKKNGKKRPLGIPTLSCRSHQALHLATLEPIAETTGDKNSYGFRPNRGTADAIAQCFIVLARKSAPQYILEGDIKACFDEISHKWMLEHIPMDKNVLRKMLKAGFMEEGIFHETESGTVQGSLISPTIANMVLDGIDSHIQTQFGKRLKTHKVHVIRYADDFIITANSKEFLENEIKPSITVFLNARGLRLSTEKTIITHIQEGFNFLGQTIRKFKDKLIIKPSDKSIASVLEKARDICNKHKGAKTGYIIEQLNPIIRGWANYHRHVVSSATFSKIDSEIHKILWRWAKRRHPTKNLSWIKDKYFKSYKGRNWVFSNDSKGNEYPPRLFRASEIKIKRHIKIKQDANPFDPKWEIYFERRNGNKLRSGNGKNLAKYLLENQRNLCSLCKNNISIDKSWEYHFKQKWIHGGLCRAHNLTIVHPDCHERLHAKMDNKTGALARAP